MIPIGNGVAKMKTSRSVSDTYYYATQAAWDAQKALLDLRNGAIAVDLVAVSGINAGTSYLPEPGTATTIPETISSDRRAIKDT